MMERIIDFFESIINQYNEEQSSLDNKLSESSRIIGEKKDRLKSLKNNGRNIVNFSDLEILDMVNQIPLEDVKLVENDIAGMLSDENYQLDTKRKEMLYKVLQFKYLYEYEEELSIDELTYLSSFVDELLTEMEKHRVEDNNSKRRLKELKYRIGKTKDLLNTVKNNPTSIIKEYDLIESDINDSNLSEKEKRNVIQSLIDTNLSIYEKNVNNSLITPEQTVLRKREKLDREQLKELLETFGYKIEDLILKESKENQEKYIDLLLSNGDINRIEEILKAMKENGIQPFHIKLKQDREKLSFVSLLCRSNAETINTVVKYALENGITLEKLTTNLVYLVESSRDHRFMLDRENPGEETKEGLINGESTNFINNINYLKSLNFDIPTIANRSISSFSVSTQTLKYNIEIMKLYGITIPPYENKKNSFSYKSFGATKSEEMFDSFIEISKNGYDYICGCLSRLLNIPKHYMLYMVHNDSKLIPNLNISKYTKYLNDNREMSLEDKHRIGNTIEPSFERKSEYDEYVAYKILERKKQFIEGKIDKTKGNALFDYSVVESDIVKKLNSSYVDKDYPQAYVLDGVIVSKNKFLKVFNILRDKIDESNLKDIVTYSLTYNSIITEDELSKVEKEVNNILDVRRLG